MLRYGKVNDIRQLISAYFSNKIIVSINDIIFMYKVAGIDEIKEIQSNVFSILLYAYDKEYRMTDVKITLSFNPVFNNPLFNKSALEIVFQFWF